jgi:16S rRNA U516 pseudouridylate synthase RsuA-like enzyme
LKEFKNNEQCRHCSRRKAEELIADGKCLVNSTRIKLGDKADPEKDKNLLTESH